MRINHNISALNTYRQLALNNAAMAKSLEKLSSGLRINRAGDDAAGLAISEKMRAQIRGLEMASKNAQDGISLIQTAEGALQEVHSILQRMRELAVQAANDTNTPTDRKELQKEVDQLAQEIGRIGNTTEFNTQKLLNGTFTGTFHIGANEDQNLILTINDMRAYNLAVTGKVTIVNEGTYTPGSATTGDTLAQGTYTVRQNGSNYELVDAEGKVVATSSDGLTFTTKTFDGSNGDDTLVFTQKITSGEVYYDAASGKWYGTAQFDNGGLEAGTYTYDATNKVLLDSNGNVVASTTDGITFKDAKGNIVLTATTALSNGEKVTVGGINISDQASANAAITVINQAIEKVSAERAKLGAYQNRLEHTINNLGTAAENLTAAESRIRDVDMAKEMMEFTKMNILAQAATAMLAQANQTPQGVLQLLR